MIPISQQIGPSCCGAVYNNALLVWEKLNIHITRRTERKLVICVTVRTMYLPNVCVLSATFVYHNLTQILTTSFRLFGFVWSYLVLFLVIYVSSVFAVLFQFSSWIFNFMKRKFKQ